MSEKHDGLSASEWHAVYARASNDLERLMDDFETVAAALGIEIGGPADVTGGRVQAIVRAIAQRNMFNVRVHCHWPTTDTCRLRLPALPRVGDEIWLGDSDADLYVVKSVWHNDNDGITLVIDVPSHKLTAWDVAMKIEQAKYEEQS